MGLFKVKFLDITTYFSGRIFLQEFPNDSNFDGVRFEFYLSVDDCIEQKYVCTEFALFVADLFDGVELELFWSGIRSDLAFFPFY